MATGYIEYITSDGDRWDLISWNFYGDPFAYEGIIRANPSVPVMPVLPAGIRLLIPVLDKQTITPAPPAGLPPWI